MTERDRETCAYHEAGHAVVAALLPGADPLHKVTIIPRGRALGLTMQLPEGDRHMYTRQYLEAQIAILMGGRVAEELFLDQMTSGASNDIERATEIARAMVCNYGMSSLGPLAYRPGTAGHPTGGAGVSEALAQRVDDEIQKCVMRGYDAARAIVETRRVAVRALAAELRACRRAACVGVHRRRWHPGHCRGQRGLTPRGAANPGPAVAGEGG
jgi:cell division protease FtsH